MKSVPVEILPIAQNDVDQTMTYIAADDPLAADRLLENLLNALQQVSEYPFSGSEFIVSGRRPRAYMKVYVHPYNIFYRVMDEKVVVMRVLHEKMDVQRHLPKQR